MWRFKECDLKSNLSLLRPKAVLLHESPLLKQKKNHLFHILKIDRTARPYHIAHENPSPSARLKLRQDAGTVESAPAGPIVTVAKTWEPVELHETRDDRDRGPPDTEKSWAAGPRAGRTHMR